MNIKQTAAAKQASNALYHKHETRVILLIVDEDVTGDLILFIRDGDAENPKYSWTHYDEGDSRAIDAAVAFLYTAPTGMAVFQTLAIAEDGGWERIHPR